MPVFSGAVTNLADKPIKKPVDIILVKQEGVKTMKSDSTGDFMIDHNDMVTIQNKKLSLMVSTESADSRYKLKLTDPYVKISEIIPSHLSYKDYSTVAEQNTSNMQLTGSQNTIQLKEVKITDKKDVSFFGSRGFGGNACGDYVCKYGVLNCPNHRAEFDNRLPVEYAVYKSNGGQVTYHGCAISQKNEFSANIKGIYNSMEFYPSDYSEISPSQPEYISTIYWKHIEKITAGKETNFSFYTSDITGRFKIIIQGITDNDVVYGEKTFSVAKPK